MIPILPHNSENLSAQRGINILSTEPAVQYDRVFYELLPITNSPFIKRRVIPSFITVSKSYNEQIGTLK